MLRNIKQIFTHNLINIPGWKTNRKIVVFESDDWGSIRMPSLETYQELLKDYKINDDPFLKYDSLASHEDLEKLFDVLSSFKDKNGNPAILTANCVVSNPNYKKIEESDFQQYHYEHFTETLKQYPDHYKSFELWQEGIDKRLFFPQYHGREHINVYQWMNGLSRGDRLLMEAFKRKMFYITPFTNYKEFGYMKGLDYFSEAERREKPLILRDGVRIFHDIFGFMPKSFIANNYTWDDLVEKELFSNGISLLQGISTQRKPQLNTSKHYKYIWHYTGQKNRNNQHYVVRNAFFEPSIVKSFDWVNNCLKRIEIAFRWRKPAIIGSHRLNYIGSIVPENRDQNLILLRELLLKITNTWPEVEFLTTDQLPEIFD